MIRTHCHAKDMAHQVIMLQSEFVEIPNVRMSRLNLFCSIPPSLGAILEF